MRDKHQIIEEPCEVKVSSTVLKTNGVGDNLVEFTELAVCSNGEVFENPKAYRRMSKRMKRLQRSVSRKVKGSNNRKKAVRKLAKLHAKVSNIRKDSIHKLTYYLAKNHSVIKSAIRC
ncbi:hypothetical protein AA650_13995 [Anabaena sp. WA102]|nr:hypothetical protein AA650_01645 [Anabaena sp. WA102]ALB41429.1 hypothetical protein AA650_13995 [Anabaena sp. WA102]